MIPGWLGWALGAFALGFTAACLTVPRVLRRHRVLLWPEDWLAAWRLRRRKMSDPDDRISP